MSSFPPPGVVCQQNIAIRAVRGDDAHRQDFILEFENEEDWRDKPLRWCYESRDTKNDVQRGFSGSAMGRAKRMIFSRTVYKTLSRGTVFGLDTRDEGKKVSCVLADRQVQIDARRVRCCRQEYYY